MTTANVPPLPLEGIRVVDFTWAIAGPQATRVLADLGAEVIRIENESHLDSSRLGSQGDRETDSYNTRPLFNNLNRNKLSITANLNHPAGREVVERLIGVSDVLVENFSAGVLNRLGLGYDRLRELNPRIVAASLSGFGQTGRDASYITWGHVAAAVSGCAAMSGLPGYEPASWGYSYLDHVAGFHGAVAVLMALRERTRSGVGQYIDVSQIEAGMALCGVPVLDYQVNARVYERIGNRSRWPTMAPHGAYRCRDAEDGSDRWITISAETEAQWRALRSALDLPEDDPRFTTNAVRVANQDALDALIGERTRRLDGRDLMYKLQAVHVPAGIAQTARDKLDADPQLAHRGFYPTADHPDLGSRRFEGFPVRFSAARWRVERGAPRLGEHTREVLTQVLGYTDIEVDELVAVAAV